MIPLAQQIKYMENLLTFVEKAFPELIAAEPSYTEEKHQREVATIQAIIRNLKSLPEKPEQIGLNLQSHSLI